MPGVFSQVDRPTYTKKEIISTYSREEGEGSDDVNLKYKIFSAFR